MNQGPRDHVARLDRQGPLVLLALKASVARPASMARKASPVQQDHPAPLDLQAPLDRLDQRDLLARPVHPVLHRYSLAPQKNHLPRVNASRCARRISTKACRTGNDLIL